ncbi:MAG: MFS transporter [Dehalococcoidia bacterium]|nr:MFS transporter [Dehalococcoidia bacterium]
MSHKPTLFYGWVVLAIGFATVVAGYACRNTFSVFYPAIVDEFGWGRGNTALIFSINVFVYGLVAPFAGDLIDRFKPRYILAAGAIIMGVGVSLCSLATEKWQFYVLYGVVASIGLSVAGWAPVVAIVSKWFVKRRALSMGILGAGFGSSLVSAYVAQYLISSFGWRTAYVFIGVFAAAVIPPMVILFVRGRPEDKGLHADGMSAIEVSERDAAQEADETRTPWARTEWTLRRAARTHQFWLLFAAAFVVLGLVEQIAIAHQVYFYRDAGYSDLTAASFYGIFGVCFILGNLSGSFSDRLGRERCFIPASLIGAAALLLLFGITDTTQPWIPVTFAIVFGFCLGSIPCVFYAAVADLFHGKHYGKIVGMMVMGFAMGGTLSPWLAGYLYDTTGSYQSTFVLLIAGMLLTGALMWFVAPRKLSPVRH